MINKRCPQLIKTLPLSVKDLKISRSFFTTTGLDDSFLHHPVTKCSKLSSYKIAKSTAKNIPCVNDCAERGAKLIEDFNSFTKDERKRRNSFYCKSLNITGMNSILAIARLYLTYKNIFELASEHFTQKNSFYSTYNTFTSI